jgi:hypothetical protein
VSEDDTCVGVEAGVSKGVGVACDPRMTIPEGQGFAAEGGMGVPPVISGVCVGCAGSVGCSVSIGAGIAVGPRVAQPESSKAKLRSIEQDVCNLFILVFAWTEDVQR